MWEIKLIVRSLYYLLLLRKKYFSKVIGFLSRFSMGLVIFTDGLSNINWHISSPNMLTNLFYVEL